MARTRGERRTTPPDRRGWGIVVIPVVQFLLAGAAVLAILVVALSIASRRVGEREAIVEARTKAQLAAQGVIEPTFGDEVLAGDEAALAELDALVRDAVLDASLVRVKIWSADGTVLYSDEPRQIGEQFALGEDELEAIEQGIVDAEVSDLEKPENVYERDQGKLLEVYLPIESSPSGQKVLFEAYFSYDAVEESGQRIWESFAPFTIGALIVLELVQIPLAWSLARRLRIRQLEREDLLERAIAASEHERRRIARDLHDGVVQDLAGVSYSLAAMRRSEEGPSDDDLDAAAETVRTSIEALRTLLVELYPPNLAEEGLAPALADLLARARAVGLVATADTAGLPADLPQPAVRLVYRVVQEALRNVITHADAGEVTLVARAEGSLLWAEVADDGVGFDLAEARERAADGHVGLLGLRDLVAESGARLAVTSQPGNGTTVRIEVPLP